MRWVGPERTPHGDQRVGVLIDEDDLGAEGAHHAGPLDAVARRHHLSKKGNLCQRSRSRRDADDDDRVIGGSPHIRVAARVLVVAAIVGSLVAITASVRDGDDPVAAEAGRAAADADVDEPGIADATVTPVGDTVVVAVALVDETPIEGSEVFVWGLSGPPLAEARFAAGSWVTDLDVTVEGDGGALQLELPGSVGAVAVSTFGHRVPTVGYFEPSAAGGSEVLVGGAIAEVVQASIAEAQAGYGGLDPIRRSLASALLGRQLLDGTSVRRAVNDAGNEATVTVTVRYPTVTQTTTDATGRTVELRVGLDDVQSCADGVCAPVAVLDVPATAAAVLVARPQEVAVELLEGGSFGGDATVCAQIDSDLPDGPAPGRSCWLPDGTLVEADRDDGVRFELVERRP